MPSSQWGFRTHSGPLQGAADQGLEQELGDRFVTDCFCVNWSSHKGVQVLTLIPALLPKTIPFMKQQKANTEYF